MKKSALLLILLNFLFASCTYMTGKSINGDGNRTTQERSVADFNGIDLVGDMDVFLQAGSAFSVKVEADQNLLEYIETTKKDNTLEIGSKEGYNLNSKSGIKVYVTAPDISDLEITGSGNIESGSKITSGKRLKIVVTGSGNVKMEIEASEVTATITGSGNVLLTGNTKDFRAEVTGSGNIKCFDLLSESTNAEVSGSGDAEVFASKELKIDINGSGTVAYKGNPSSLKQDISGSGSAQKVQ